jgi:hypothetical protein
MNRMYSRQPLEDAFDLGKQQLPLEKPRSASACVLQWEPYVALPDQAMSQSVVSVNKSIDRFPSLHLRIPYVINRSLL